MTRILAVASVLFLSSCDVCERPLASTFEQEVRDSMQSIARGEKNVGDLRSLATELSCCSNTTDRAACFRIMGKVLFSLKLDKLKYKQQSRCMNAVLRFGYHECLGQKDLSAIDEWTVRLNALAWVRANLKRLQPVRSVDVKAMDEKTYVAYRRWRQCYNEQAMLYAKTVSWMERALLPNVVLGMRMDDRQKLFALVEKTLGRALMLDVGGRRPESKGNLWQFPVETMMLSGPAELGSDSDMQEPSVGLGESNYRLDWKMMRGEE